MPVHKKINEARIAFHALPLKKSGHNTFAGYKYFELADFVIPALRIFNDVGLCAIISFSETTASMHIVDVEDGHRLSFTAQWVQPILKVATRFRTLALVRLTPPATSGQQPFALSSMTLWMLPQARANQLHAKFISDKQFAELQALVDETKTDMALLCKHYKINALKELQESRFDAVKAALEKKLA
jgi:hypothetical protein